jgi:ABC-type thiamin/hydroxymethylpyrimidine transport system permease subunit
MNANEFALRLAQVILNPVISLLFGLALVIFTWGVIQYIQNAANPEGRKQGQQHIIWGLVGMFIMVSVFGILQMAKTTILGQ